MGSPDVAEALRMTKQQLSDLGAADSVTQVGVEVLDDAFTWNQIPETDLAEPTILTFLVNTGDRSIVPLDSGDLVGHWQTPVEALAELVLNWLADADVGVEAHAYVTASLTPAAAVNDDPHFDDAMFIPGAGVGAVAVVGSGNGPRVATTPLLDCQPVPTTLVEPTKAQKEAFATGAMGRIDVGADTVALFPQFAQLHSGPGPLPGAEVRQLLVFRVGTVPRNVR